MLKIPHNKIELNSFKCNVPAAAAQHNRLHCVTVLCQRLYTLYGGAGKAGTRI